MLSGHDEIMEPAPSALRRRPNFASDPASVALFVAGLRQDGSDQNWLGTAMPRPRHRVCLQDGLKLDLNHLARNGFIRFGANIGAHIGPLRSVSLIGKHRLSDVDIERARLLHQYALHGASADAQCLFGLQYARDGCPALFRRERRRSSATLLTLSACAFRPVGETLPFRPLLKMGTRSSAGVVSAAASEHPSPPRVMGRRRS